MTSAPQNSYRVIALLLAICGCSLVYAGTTTRVSVDSDENQALDSEGSDSFHDHISGDDTNDKSNGLLRDHGVFVPPSGSNPVVLVHGWCGIGVDGGTFGNLRQVLEDNSERQVLYFNYSMQSTYSSYQRRDLVTLAGELGKFINRFADGNPVDVVTHSMGGLITRAWMAGLANVPYEKGVINKLVLAATPNFGTGINALSDLDFPCPEDRDVRKVQIDQMAYNSPFIKRLNESWQAMVNVEAAGARVINPENIFLLRGCKKTNTGLSIGSCENDGVVEAGSASLPRPIIGQDYIQRDIYYQHVSLSSSSSQYWEGLVDVDDDTHGGYQYIAWFLGLQAEPDLPTPGVPSKTLMIIPLVEGHDSASTPFVETLIDDLKQIYPYSPNIFLRSRKGAAQKIDERTGWHTFYPSVRTAEESREYQVNMEHPRIFSKNYRLDYPVEDAISLTLEPGRAIISEPIIVDAKVDLPDLIVSDVHFCNFSNDSGCADFFGDSTVAAMPLDLLDIRYNVGNFGHGRVDNSNCTRFFLSSDARRGADIELDRALRQKNSPDGYKIYTRNIAGDCIKRWEWFFANELDRLTDLSFKIRLQDFAPPVIPSGTPEGIYYLLLCADDNNKSYEHIGSNNCTVSNRQIQITFVESPTVSPGP